MRATTGVVRIQCNYCGLMKPVGDFPIQRRVTTEGPTTYWVQQCKPCRNAYQRENLKEAKLSHYRRKRSYYNGQSKNYRATHKETVLNQHLVYTYGITIEDYRAMLDAQGGRCAICRHTPEEIKSKRSRLVVDHCHDTGKVRGLLCDLCNKGIGSFRDDAERLNLAANYLLSHKDSK